MLTSANIFFQNLFIYLFIYLFIILWLRVPKLLKTIIVKILCTTTLAALTFCHDIKRNGKKGQKCRLELATTDCNCDSFCNLLYDCSILLYTYFLIKYPNESNNLLSKGQSSEPTTWKGYLCTFVPTLYDYSVWPHLFMCKIPWKLIIWPQGKQSLGCVCCIITVMVRG